MKNKSVLQGLWLIVSILFGIITSYIIEDNKTDVVVQFLASLVVFQLTLLIGFFVTNALDLSSLKNEIIKTRNKSISSKQLLSCLQERSVDSISDSLKEITKKNNDFICYLSSRMTESLIDDLRYLSSGYYSCGPDEEAILTKELLKKSKTSIKAVSYEDIPWWNSSHGQVYLKYHKDLIKKNPSIKICRIFILTKEEEKQLKHIIEGHKNLDIKTYVLRPDDLQPNYLKDFVIYDDSILRDASLIKRGEISKSAIFNHAEGQVNKSLDDFNTIYDLAYSKQAETAHNKVG